MSTAYRRNQSSGPPLSDPFWMAVVLILVLAFAIWALPAIIIAFFTQRYLQRVLHWKLNMLLWLGTSVISFFLLSQQYSAGLKDMMNSTLGLYVAQALQHHANILQWNFRALWPATWAMWLHTLIGVPIAGLWFEVSSNATGNITRMLRQQEQRRQNRAHRAQQSAKRQTRRPDRLPDQVGGMMVMGVPIKRKREE